MSSNEIETNDVNGSKLTEEGPSPAGILDRRTIIVIIQILLLLIEESGIAKRIISLWSAIY